MTVDTSNLDVLLNNGQLNESELYENKGKTLICEIIKNGKINELENFINKYNVSLHSYSSNGFDILIYTIKNSDSVEMINFIIEKTPYKNLNYTVKDNNNTIGTPLFLSLAQNKFKIADLLMENGADINMTLCCNLDKIREEDVYLTQNPYKYYDVIANRDCFTHDYSREIYSNIIQYLCEVDSLTQQNLEYIKNHGFEINAIRTGIIKQLERNNKFEYAKMISNLISEQDID
ncbi:hypothetical protein BCR36DRAFT_586975 [Piromyces finnis]|uniref:Uncharacterized protein n=1 Tax=Piromyces finnis TaxID=1754191 RepID=A0A1Y1UYU4_9FUNG|nr:hypothetical protein BCR36DRAFT_586975 [Piromyces finnis]|eukprot:ORX42831.1 hypothetical protein BCR36DRAFT_586975 [Piromyces finnis]